MQQEEERREVSIETLLLRNMDSNYDTPLNAI